MSGLYFIIRDSKFQMQISANKIILASGVLKLVSLL